MAVRSGSDSLYRASANLDYVESQLAKLMFIVGLDWANINTTTIDDVINKVRSQYKYSDAEQEAWSAAVVAAGNIGNINISAAVNDWLQGQNAKLTMLARRLWWWKHLSEANS